MRLEGVDCREIKKAVLSGREIPYCGWEDSDFDEYVSWEKLHNADRMIPTEP